MSHFGTIPFFIEPATVAERIRMVAVELDSFPQDSNPFHHDLTSMGIVIYPGVLMLQSNNGEGLHQQLVHTNSVTGQRFALVPVPVEPRYVPYFYIPEDHRESGYHGAVVFKNSIYQSEPSFKYVHPDDINKCYVHTVAGAFESPVYYRYDRHLILRSVVENSSIEELIEIIRKSNFNDYPEEVYKDVATKLRFLDWNND